MADTNFRVITMSMPSIRRRDLLGGLVLLAAPTVAVAQQSSKMPVVGYLWHAANEEEERPYFNALNEGFARLGYVNGRNIRIEHRYPNEDPEQFRRMSAELVSLKPDVLMGGTVAITYLKNATKTIPIVFMFVPDPVGLNLVESLAHPGGNITGLSNFGRDLLAKRLQLFKDAVPGLSSIGVLVNPDEPATARLYIETCRSAGAELGLAILVFEARSVAELEFAFDKMVSEKVQGFTVASGGVIFQGRYKIAKLAVERRLPWTAFSRETFEAGALMSYGPDQREMCRRSAAFAQKILQGSHPRDLPVEQPTQFELFYNLKVARALGLTISQTMLLAATEVVE